MKNLPVNHTFPDASQLILGCMGLGGSWDAAPLSPENVKHAHAAIDAALEAGINFFDHADIYTLGKAEMVFGEALKQRPGLRDKIYLQSKCGIRFADESNPQRYDFSRSWITSAVEASLSRLGVEQLDVLELHRPDPLMDPQEVAQAFEQLKADGKVKHFGVSNMTGPQIQFLQSCLPFPLISNQLEMSLAEHAFVDEGIFGVHPGGAEINFTAGTMEYCRHNNVQLQSWGSLAQGLYTGKDITSQPEHVKQTAAKVATLANEYSVSREAIVLAWLMRHPAKIQPIIGTTNPARILACAEAHQVELTREQWYDLYISARGERLP